MVLLQRSRCCCYSLSVVVLLYAHRCLGQHSLLQRFTGTAMTIKNDNSNLYWQQRLKASQPKSQLQLVFTFC